MLRQNRKNNQRAQVFLEYVIIVTVMIVVMMAMSTLIKRASQGMVKVVADQIGNQVNADQQFEDGYLVRSQTLTRSVMDKTKTEFLSDTTYGYGDSVDSATNAVVYLGTRQGN